MKSIVYLLATALVAGAAATGAAAEAPGDKIPGSFICVFKAGAVAKGNVRAEANRAAGNGGGQVGHVYDTAIRGFSANLSEAGARQVAARNPKIAYCEQDQIVTTGQSALEFRTLGKPPAPQPQETPPWGVTRVRGGGAYIGNNRAWVIDTGIDLDHPDLNVDTGRSRNFVSRETSPDDLNGHGTHVAGTIGAKANNSIGVIGVAANAPVVAVRVLNRRGSGSNSDVIKGVDYVAANGVAGDVANMSLGGGVSQALDDAVKCAADGVGANCAAEGVVKFALAAGNESESAELHSPARANGPNIFTVSSFAKGTSATDTDDPWSSFSNFGPPVDYAEPGSSIPSTYKDGGYATISGTSMAAPHLAGILLAGTVRSTSTVDGDPDGNADKIGER